MLHSVEIHTTRTSALGYTELETGKKNGAKMLTMSKVGLG
jgi:hypothetical protein